MLRSSILVPYQWQGSIVLLFVTAFLSDVNAEIERLLRVPESASVGQQVGFVQDPLPTDTDQQNFYVVFTNPTSQAEKLISVNERTGEVVVTAQLDHEQEAELVFLAIPTNGDITIKVVLQITDENDHTPTFSVDSIQLEISEFAQIGTELPLPLATDEDSPPFSIQKYRIVEGNVNNVFRLASRRLNNVLYVDLVVNGQLDREYRDHYDLLVEAIDGDDPPKVGKLSAHVSVLDANDNAPMFHQSRYTADIPANASKGLPVLTVLATDPDADENSRVSYKFKRSDEVSEFDINESTGLIRVAQTPLVAGRTYEVLVVAYDHGLPQPLESTVFVAITAQERNRNDKDQSLDIVWLTDDGSPMLSEGLTLGYVLARVLVRGGSESSVLSLAGCESICLKETDTPTVYLLIVCGSLDRETEPHYRILLTLRDKNEKTILDHPIHVEVADVNDNAPQWNQTQYHVVMRIDNDASNMFRFAASDVDIGENARIRYSIEGTSIFTIHPDTGVLSPTSQLNCSFAESKFRVTATDHGAVSLSTSVDVVVDVLDSATKSLTFEKSIYEVSVREDVEPASCLLQVAANSSGCGKSSKIQYAFDEELGSTRPFAIDIDTGKVCISSRLDYESTPRHILRVVAHDAEGRTTHALLNIIVEDVNDENPRFDPMEYSVSLNKESVTNASIVTVLARDKDFAGASEIRYFLENSSSGIFRIDETTGRIYVAKPSQIGAASQYTLHVRSKDNGGLTSEAAKVIVAVVKDASKCVQFSEPFYAFVVNEDVLPGIVIGSVSAWSDSPYHLQLTGSSANSPFHIDSISGKLTVSSDIRADHDDIVMLNIEGKSTAGCSNFTQVRITIKDTRNDNAPEFPTKHAEVNVREDFPIHEAFFAVFAMDRDRHENGKVTYELISSTPVSPVIIRPLTGQLMLAAALDYESVQKYRIVVRAQDQGIPPCSTTMSLDLNVLDINDNPPEFSKQIYNVEVPENAPLMHELFRLKASDRDSGDNARVKYTIAGDVHDFGINTLTGDLYVRRSLDREAQAVYTFLITGADQGQPPLASNVTVHVLVTDINDNTPNCSTVIPLTVPDGHDLRDAIGTIHADDPDAGLNGTVAYHLQKTSEYFDVKPNGDVYLKKKLRASLRQESFRFSVVVQDRGPEPRSTVCPVFMRREAASSSVALLEPVERTLFVDPECTVPCQIVRINATNVAQWRIERNEVSKMFEISDEVLRLVNKPEEGFFERPHKLTLNLLDDERRQKHVTFTLKRKYSVNNNESATIHITVSENTPIGSQLYSNSTRTTEDNGFFTLSNATNLPFVMDETTGAFYLASLLDYNSRQEYHLHVVHNSPCANERNSSVVVVEVADENNHSPRFSHSVQTWNVSEDTPIGTVIGQLEAYDADEGINGAVGYQLLSHHNLFMINTSTGEVSLKRGLSFNQACQSKYALRVQAEDSAMNAAERMKSECLVIIEVDDTNDASPVFVSSANVTVTPADVSNSDPVHYFVATDSDSGIFGRVAYAIVSTYDPYTFRLDGAKGALYLLKLPATKTALVVRATDGDEVPRFTDQVFSVQPDNVSTRWIYFDTRSSELTLHADAPVGTTIANYKSSDADIVEFRLLPAVYSNFSLGATDGILRIVGTLEESSYRLTIHVTDLLTNATDFTSAIVNVVGNVHAGPKVSHTCCGNISVPENVAISNLQRVFATLERNSIINGPITYHIEGGSGSDLFAINNTTGVVSCKELDRENASEHVLIISASDNSTPKKADVCTLRIVVLDENDNVPMIDPSVPDTLEITDTTEVNQVLTTVVAMDADDGDNGVLRYSLSEDKSGLLDIHPEHGELLFARDLPFSESEWIVTVKVEDCGKSRVLSTEKRIRIAWRRSPREYDVGTPQFIRQKYVATVVEGMPRGQFVAQVEGTDRILRTAPLAYSIVGGNRDFAFDIDEFGKITTTQELDAEVVAEYTLKVVGAGNFMRLPETSVEIRVLNTNDNSPYFPEIGTVKLSESLPIGSHVVTVTASDVDEEAHAIEYSLSPANEWFDIGRFTGSIHLKRELDYEDIQQHELRVQAYDGENVSYMNFTIDVIDENDNAPVFDSDLYDISVPFNARTGTVLGRITATDKDLQSGVMRYRVLTNDSPVSVDEITGEIRLLRPLDGTHFVALDATDSGSPPLSTITNLKLQSTSSVSHIRPTFDRKLYKFIVSEDFPLYQKFGSVRLSNGHMMECVYAVDKRFVNTFQINRRGELSLVSGLDRERMSEYRFNVSARVASTEPAAVEVIVQVGDVNDNTPAFMPSSTKEIRLSENMKRGVLLGSLVASDKDDSENGRVHYSIAMGNEYGMINVDSSSGRITFHHWDDDVLMERTNFTVFISAEDNGVPSKWSLWEVTVLLDYETWSGSAPIFPLTVYKTFVAETTPSGGIVLTTRASSRWGRAAANWNYSLRDNDETFTINSTSGEVRTNSLLDYERKSTYAFSVVVEDTRQRSAIASVYVNVIGVDEYPPVFQRPTYTFKIPMAAEAGMRIGSVYASDEDIGIGGKVKYSLLGDVGFAKIDEDTGVLILTERVPYNSSTVDAVVLAASGPTQFARAGVRLEITDDDTTEESRGMSSLFSSNLIVWFLVAFTSILCLLVLVLFVIHLHNKKPSNKRPQKKVYSVTKGSVASMANINRNSPAFGKRNPSSAPPSARLPTSSSGTSSACSRTAADSSAERCPTRSYPDSGIDPDAISVSDSSVTEYLAQLGVTNGSFPRNPLVVKRQADDMDPDLSDLIYAKVDEFAGGPSLYNSAPREQTKYFLPTTFAPRPPSYQPLSDILSQLSRDKSVQKPST